MLFYFYVKAFTFSINSNTVPVFDEQMIFVKSTIKAIIALFLIAMNSNRVIA